MSNLSLKSLIPHLAPWVSMTPAALYERQRALVRAGLLHSKAGRGPGSGVRATPESVAMLLIALLATGSLTEAASQARALAGLKSATKRCPLTDKKTFGSALTAILSSEALAARARWISVERGGTKAEAWIGFKKTEEEKGGHPHSRDSLFGFKNARFESHLSMKASLSLPFDALADGLKETN